MVGITAMENINPYNVENIGATSKMPWRAGITSTVPSSRTPMQNAPRLYQLRRKPSSKIECLLRQLKP